MSTTPTGSNPSQRHGTLRSVVWSATVAIRLLVLSLIVPVGAGQWPGSSIALAEGPGLDGEDINVLAKVNLALERIAETVTPSIVNIQTTQGVELQRSRIAHDPFFRQFFGDTFGPFNIPREQREHALRSGVIVSRDGVIVTNNHDIHARLVGLDTAISSDGSGMGGGGGSVGIGFAIPANVGKHVMQSLVTTGKVERGYLGAAVGDRTEKLAGKFGVSDVSGAVVEHVSEGSPAAKAGLRPGDVIQEIDHHPAENPADFEHLAASAKGDIPLRINRQRNNVFVVISRGG